ncbi:MULTISPECIES: glycosyltransferase [Pseudoalteromonas]|uniref:glycosyltransferase n=1 Tax=Pseudoalteromonas TaxID=53246 RepID=UPI0015817E8A|nr:MULTISPECIES: glycosyltransferase [Pseudoalteromonas]MDI4652853.1 glycosyltransferase [Pseudoalteromonas shioyasakiensis]NUJ39642.1 glycosyltransferase [Pseudoalteromonas sp. 0303]
MKVLHIGKYYFPFFGGIEKVNQDIVECASYQAEVNSLVLAHQSERGKATCYEKINGVEIRKVAIKKVVAYAPIAPDFLKELNQAIADFKPDLIHIHMPNLSAFTCLFSKSARKIPWVIHWHSDVLGAAPDLKIKLLYPFYRVFEKALLQKAKEIIVTSPPYLEHSVALRTFKDKCNVIPLGIKDKVNHKKSKTQSEEFNLLMVGRLTYYKGHALMLDALSMLPNSTKIKLKIIGGGELREELESKVHSLGLCNKVEFLGHVSEQELVHELSKTDLVCLPSIEKTEAFGVVLLEAAMFSKPALVSNVVGSGMSWVVQHKETGFVVENNSASAIYQQLNSVLDDKHLLLTLGKQARTRFENSFNLEVVATKTLNLYKQCIER